MRRPAPLGPIPSNEALNLSSAKISHECYHPRRAMPILPVNHSDPFAATLGVMLYPGVDEASQRQARAFTAQALAEPLRRFHEAGHRLAYEDLARIFSDAGTPLDDIKQRWWDGLSTGETFKALFALAYTDRTLASWGNATKLAELAAEENKVHASRSSLYDARSRYGSVAHLWAAWCIRERRFQSDPDNGYEFWHDFQFFLAEAEFLTRCIRCNQCAEVCENDCIQFLSGSAADGTPIIRPREKGCILCMKCTNVCPTGALQPISSEPDAIRKQVRMGKRGPHSPY